jgi:AraC-like DNA-binding protein
MDNCIQFIKPSAILQNYVRDYYMGEFSGTSNNDEIEQKPISDGCIELFIGYQNTTSTCYTNTGEAILPTTAIVGAHNLCNAVKAMAMEPDHKQLKFVSVNFTINGFYDIFKIPASELYNCFHETSLVIGNEIRYLQDQLDHSSDNRSRKQILDNFFICQLNKNYHKRYQIKTGFDISRFIHYQKGNIRINQLMAYFRVSERTLQRETKSALGLSLKEYCKIVRFNNLFECVNIYPTVNWSDMVSKFGYYDQAHLINEFKSATGVTPSLFLKYRRKNMFNVGNHLVILKSDVLYDEIKKAISEGEESYQEYYEFKNFN